MDIRDLYISGMWICSFLALESTVERQASGKIHFCQLLSLSIIEMFANQTYELRCLHAEPLWNLGRP